MALSTHCTPTVEKPRSAGIEAGREHVRVGAEQWFARAAGPGEPPSVEDLAWPGRFRRNARALLSLWGLLDLRDSVDTVLTEMVTNALEHGGGTDIGVRIGRTATGVRIEVADSAPEPSIVPASSLDAEQGRGLLLIHCVADRWGFKDRGYASGKWVWAYFAAGTEHAL